MLPALRRTGGYFPSLLDDWSGIFDEFSRLAEPMSKISGEQRGAPMEVWEHNDRYVVLVDVPGVNKEQSDRLDISMEGNNLSITIRRPEPEPAEGAQLLHGGRWYGSVTRSVTLPGASAAGEVDAHLDAGVLKIEVKKQPEKQAKRIAIH